ncbi:YIP1 family protein [uncultured Butyricimonas sp.]|uniref:YIP1 family protein n=1 Tax=uncultured Butyricimonas sp. TaxID=1268785 RepID=UPI0026DC0999|nr:YIP1 family protein [uncultured Butyricimonas sp.]
MKKQRLNLLFNPFARIAGYSALGWGFLGIVLATLLSYSTGLHYHGLLHFGWAPNPAWWCFAAEHLVIWLIPAILFYLGGLLLSRSRIRIVDVLGTVAFAQLPFIIMNLFYFIPSLRFMTQLNPNALSIQELLAQPEFIKGVWFSLFSLIFFVWVLIWMFHALRVSCNLKGYRLGILYAIAITGGDLICRMLINLCYNS